MNKKMGNTFVGIGLIDDDGLMFYVPFNII